MVAVVHTEFLRRLRFEVAVGIRERESCVARTSWSAEEKKGGTRSAFTLSDGRKRGIKHTMLPPQPESCRAVCIGEREAVSFQAALLTGVLCPKASFLPASLITVLSSQYTRTLH